MEVSAVSLKWHIRGQRWHEGPAMTPAIAHTPDWGRKSWGWWGLEGKHIGNEWSWKLSKMWKLKKGMTQGSYRWGLSGHVFGNWTWEKKMSAAENTQAITKNQQYSNQARSGRRRARCTETQECWLFGGPKLPCVCSGLRDAPAPAPQTMLVVRNG